MPEKQTLERARQDKREGKAPTTQAGEFIKEEMDHIREGKHGARSPQQAIAIGLSKARRAGVDLPPPQKGKASEKTRKSAERDYERGHGAASHAALSRHAHAAAAEHTAGERSAAAKKASRTKGPAERSAAARKAARTRAKSH
jgi:hypothetical protein